MQPHASHWLQPLDGSFMKLSIFSINMKLESGPKATQEKSSLCLMYHSFWALLLSVQQQLVMPLKNLN